MGNSYSMKKINYEDMQTVVKNPEIYMLINTLPIDNQDCLISTTVSVEKEEAAINKYLKENRGIKIIVYGKHCNDELVDKKYQHEKFTNRHIVKRLGKESTCNRFK